MAGGNIPFVDGQVVDAVDQNLIRNPKFQQLTTDVGAPPFGIIAFSSTIWVAISGSSSRRTTDAGVTWAAPTSTTANMNGQTAQSTVTAAKGICIDVSSGNVTITSDSGANWAAASVDPANLTAGHACAFFSGTNAIVGGAVSSGVSVYLSTDSGDNWTVSSSGPTATTAALSMFDSSNGFLVDNSGNIWVTSDGGDNWTDSTKNLAAFSGSTRLSIVALSATTGIAVGEIGKAVDTFDTAGSTVNRLDLDLFASTSPESELSNLIESDNGNFYFVLSNWSRDSLNEDTVVNFTLFRSFDSGVSWSVATLPGIAPSSVLDWSRNGVVLEKYDTDKLVLVANDRHLMHIDLTGDLNAAVTT